MRIFGHSRALRAVVLACGIAWFAPAADLAAATLNSSGASELAETSAEPFGLFAQVLSDGGLRHKWHGVQRRLDDEMVQLALCEGDPDGCVSPGRTAISRHCRRRKGPRRPRPPRRDQSRDQPCHQADERSGPIWRDRRLGLAACRAHPRRRRLRRLCDRKIRCVAARRHLGRRFADRDHARHHPSAATTPLRRRGWMAAG